MDKKELLKKINLQNPDIVSFCDDTKELLDISMKYNKFHEFKCQVKGKMTSYVECTSNCDLCSECTEYEKKEDNLEIIEFLMDLSYSA